MIIVSNDEDFLDRINLKGFPPKVILLHVSEQRKKFNESILIKHKADIEMLSQSSEHGLLEIC